MAMNSYTCPYWQTIISMPLSFSSPQHRRTSRRMRENIWFQTVALRGSSFVSPSW